MTQLGRAALLFTVALMLFCLVAAVAMAQPSETAAVPGVMLSIDTVYKITGLMSLILSMAAMLYSWFANRGKDIDRRFREGRDRMDRHESRLQALAQEQQSMPGNADLHRIELKLNSISGDMKAISATMQGMHESLKRTENTVSRHEDHLRGNG
ncbi:MAG: hypothetical protein GOVbin2371_27 [Prokaryotic dsDNA virus sp.]|nr:hypothetical protein [Salipiger sp.]QDP47442.1 MAG: hypothetical protein GOVbin2371_27 [Prokaryotic dsDNA virus sp.]|tara:strand:+ start:7371 stop:7832 length:462 start_codon:yes stop_codon:yes gene_type:complete